MFKNAAACLMATCFFLFSTAVISDQRTYRIAVVPWVGWSPCHVAAAKGFWKELGVDVSVINMDSNIQMNDALMAGKVDIQFDMLGTAIGRFEEGKSVIVIAETDWSDGGDKIIIKKGLDLGALKNRTIAVYLDEPSISYFLNQFLATEGLQVSDFRLEQAKPEVTVEMFVKNQVQMLMAYDPPAETAVVNGNGVVIATSADYPGSVPEGMLMLRSVFDKSRQEDLENIIRGWARAVEWSANADNWQEYQQILNDKTFAGESAYSEAELKKMLGEVRIHSPKDMLKRNKTGGATELFIENVRSFMQQNEILNNDFSVADVFDNSIVEAALQN